MIGFFEEGSVSSSGERWKHIIWAVGWSGHNEWKEFIEIFALCWSIKWRCVYGDFFFRSFNHSFIHASISGSLGSEARFVRLFSSVVSLELTMLVTSSKVVTPKSPSSVLLPGCTRRCHHLPFFPLLILPLTNWRSSQTDVCYCTIFIGRLCASEGSGTSSFDNDDSGDSGLGWAGGKCRWYLHYVHLYNLIVQTIFNLKQKIQSIGNGVGVKYILCPLLYCTKIVI